MTEDEWAAAGVAAREHARACVRVEHAPEARRIRAALSNDAWIVFLYDEHGHLHVEEISDGVRYNDEKCAELGVVRPPNAFAETQRAWDLAFATAPVGPGHIMNVIPIGTHLEVGAVYGSSHTGGIVVEYSGSHVTVELPDGDRRSLTYDHARHLTPRW